MDTKTQVKIREQRKSTSELFDGYRAKKLDLNENTFPFVFVDLTYRCNMKCNTCYNPVKPMPDMDLKYFEESISQLPDPIEIRMLGGEPTIHPHFFDFVKLAFQYGHSVYVSTNGTLIGSNVDFAHRLAEIYNNRPHRKAKLKIHLDMSGGLQENFYEIIHADRKALGNKLNCLKNLKEAGIGRTTISAVLIKGVNESVIEDLFEIASNHKRVVREVAFRSQGQIGRYVEAGLEPYKTNEWLLLMQKKGLLAKEHFSKVIHSGFMDERCEGKNCCYQYAYGPRLNVSFLEFLNEGCWQRGQLLEKEKKIEYMFESLEANDSNRLNEDLPEENVLNHAILSHGKK